MRVFVYEFVTGGGFAGQHLPPGLVREGNLMLQALVSDLVACPGVEVLVSRDTRLPVLSPSVKTYWVSSSSEHMDVWEYCVHRSDAVWPIAPETGGILEEVCRSVSGAKRILLNTREDTVAIAASKSATATQLRARGIPVIDTWKPGQLSKPSGEAWVLKPDRGEGCRNTCFVRSLEHLPYGDDDWVLQPYVSGQAASLSLLVHAGMVWVLGRNRQRVVLVDNRFSLLGCVVNGLNGAADTVDALAQAVVAALPGLNGFVGVDLIITTEGPVVLEVNPRLTLSYVGLSKSLSCNVAALVLDQLTQAEPPHFSIGQTDPVDVEVGTLDAV
ncbi:MULTISPECIES: ATP-grasp domain-containing protein [unclassified Thioalkalivibrio]|uniref:ATP-grasp domain-containing protein n=1 Tax=unclassified Thioalkalivibrio TaxID=2621013 RepID=UPI00037D1798|nr:MULTISPECIES: ATP-grasp domain-containing protein [unclassified Thioalkalivibrio]